MTRPLLMTLLGGWLLLAGCAHDPATRTATAKVGFIAIDSGMVLRRVVVRGGRSQGTVLLLHGFPETLHAWDAIASDLASDYEVHAFDWPGYGLSSRPPADRFSYAPRAYAHVLKEYIAKAGIDRSRLVIYATDIGALPVLLLALEEPDIARTIIVGDFAPFDRPQYMYPSLQNLKSGGPSAEQTRAAMNRGRDEILQNTFTRGLPPDRQFTLAPAFREDLSRGWDHGGMSAADAFFHDYSHFTRDQDYFETHLAGLKTPVKVVWGEQDLYIAKDMGAELAKRIGVDFRLLPGVGHYPHLQHPEQAAEEIRRVYRDAR